MTDLWHFTCDHGYSGLGEGGLLRPNVHPLMPKLGPVIWLTDDGEPSRDDVGLTSMTLSCDRMAYRYAVRWAPSCIHWSKLRGQLDIRVLADLESYGKPETWWVSNLPLRAVLAPLEVAA